MCEEEWKPVSGFEEYYAVSSQGRIRSLRTGKLIRPSINEKGYCQINMYIHGKIYKRGLHREIAGLFIGEVYDEVDHINGIPGDNRVSNLRLCTRRENQTFHQDSKRVGSWINKKTKRWQSCISVNGKKEYLGTFGTSEEASQAYLDRKAEVDKIEKLPIKQ